MKTKFQHTIMAFMALCTISACMNDENILDGSEDNNVATTGEYINFDIAEAQAPNNDAETAQLLSKLTGGATRTAFADADQKGLSLQVNWQNNDNITIQQVGRSSRTEWNNLQKDFTVEVAQDTKRAKVNNDRTMQWIANARAWYFMASYPKVTQGGNKGIRNIQYEGTDGFSATFDINKEQVCTVADQPYTENNVTYTRPDMTNYYMLGRTSAASTKEEVKITLNPIMTCVMLQVQGSTSQNVTISDVVFTLTNASGTPIPFPDRYTVSLNENDLYNKIKSTVDYVNDKIKVPVITVRLSKPVTLQPGKSVMITAFLPPYPYGTDKKIQVTVGATGSTKMSIKKAIFSSPIGQSKKLARKLSPMKDIDVTTTETSNWMDKLSDDVKLKDLSIPGAHMAGNNTSAPRGDNVIQQPNQDETIADMLNAGIRAFDFAMSNAQNQASMLHRAYWTRFGDIYTTSRGDMPDGQETPAQAVRVIKDFLDSHPKETVILIMRRQGAAQATNSGNAIAATLAYAQGWPVNKNPVTGKEHNQLDVNNYGWNPREYEQQYWPGVTEPLFNPKDYTLPNSVSFTKDLTLGQARGKIVILVRQDADFKGWYNNSSERRDGAGWINGWTSTPYYNGSPANNWYDQQLNTTDIYMTHELTSDAPLWTKQIKVYSHSSVPSSESELMQLMQLMIQDNEILGNSQNRIRWNSDQNTIHPYNAKKEMVVDFMKMAASDRYKDYFFINNLAAITVPDAIGPYIFNPNYRWWKMWTDPVDLDATEYAGRRTICDVAINYLKSNMGRGRLGMMFMDFVRTGNYSGHNNDGSRSGELSKLIIQNSLLTNNLK